MKRHLFNIVSAIVIVTLLLPISPITALASSQSKQPACTIEQISDNLAIDKAINRDDVKALGDFLSGQGYTLVDNSASISSVKCNGDKSSAIIVTIPFTQNGTTIAAHITQWSGNWNSKDLDGSIAVIESTQDVVYSYSEKKEVISETKGNWSKKAKIPFESMQGFALPLAEQDEVIETDSPQPQSNKGNFSIQPLAATSCKTVSIGKTVYTVLGFVAYKFYQRKYWCYNGSTVSSVNVSVYLSNVDPNFYYRGIVNQWDIPRATSHDSMRQGQMDNCIVKYGCIGTSYPAVQIIVYANGSYGYSTWL